MHDVNTGNVTTRAFAAWRLQPDSVIGVVGSGGGVDFAPLTVPGRDRKPLMVTRARQQAGRISRPCSRSQAARVAKHHLLGFGWRKAL
ncbi:MAG: hypothetical protein K9L65_09740 [Chromatiaceae bacterium]|nr:hypothetical protein [Chromatiaceae bacterium]